MVFIALNKVCHSNPRNIISQLCQKKEIKMKPVDFVEDVLCKDQEFMNILDSHSKHGEKTKGWCKKLYTRAHFSCLTGLNRQEKGDMMSLTSL